jgi:transcription antitermination factor NusG
MEVNPVWYALRTRSRHEKLVRDRLAGQGIEILLPTVTRLSQWKDRRKSVEFPLFPGYCFARFPWVARTPVLMVSGVVEIVGPGSRGEPIPEVEIMALKALMGSELAYDAHPYLQEGMAVRVIRGPLEGVQGILLRKAKRCRLVVAVHLIRQAAAVELDAADVIPV